jgi:hypothetical protein
LKKQQEIRIFRFIPGYGILPIIFGMKPEAVQQALGAKPVRIQRSDPLPGQIREDYEDFIGVDYDKDGNAFNVAFLPKMAEVVFEGRRLVSQSRVLNPLRTLYRFDNSPVEDVGFVIFPNIGAAVTGYHDGEVSQRAINLFKPGSWEIEKAQPIDLSRFA